MLHQKQKLVSYKRGFGVERSQLEEKEAVLKGKESVLKEEEANFEAKGD